jgi:hypothetical protein
VAPPAEPAGHTHTADGPAGGADDAGDDHDPDDPPHPKTSTATKLDWLEAEVRRRGDEQDDGTFVYSLPAVHKIIREAWDHQDPDRATALFERLSDDRLEAWDEDGIIYWDGD